MTELIDLQTA